VRRPAQRPRGQAEEVPQGQGLPRLPQDVRPDGKGDRRGHRLDARPQSRGHRHGRHEDGQACLRPEAADPYGQGGPAA